MNKALLRRALEDYLRNVQNNICPGCQVEAPYLYNYSVSEKKKIQRELRQLRNGGAK